MRYFVHNLETDKINIFTAGKADWQSLPEADRDNLKRNCLWSSSRNCWVSKAKAARFWLRDVLIRNGFEDRGTEGERLPFAEQVQATQERAEARAERMEDRAIRADAEAESRRKASDAITDMIPFGQPILVGHHSESRHRRDLAKSDSHMRKACEAADKRDHYQRRAEAARETAEGSQYNDPAFLGRRIREQEAEERQLLHRLEGKFYAHSEPEPISDECRARLETLLEECRDKLGFYRYCLESCVKTAAVTLYDRASLKGKSVVLIRGRWERIVKLNPTTVAVPNICFPTEELQRKYALKYPYSEVRDAK